MLGLFMFFLDANKSKLKKNNKYYRGKSRRKLCMPYPELANIYTKRPKDICDISQ